MENYYLHLNIMERVNTHWQDGTMLNVAVIFYIFYTGAVGLFFHM